MLRITSLQPSLLKPSHLSSIFTKNPFLSHYKNAQILIPIQSSKPTLNHQLNHFPMRKSPNFSTSSSSSRKTPPTHDAQISNKSKKKARRDLPENVLKFNLDKCSKNTDVVEAFRLYDEARSNGVPLNVYHYNVMLYLCSSCIELGSKRGFEVYKQMGIDQIAPNEATFTSMARLAAALEDPERAFDLVKEMKSFGINPRLRSYGPALFGFCKERNVERAYEVDAHMVESGVVAEEPEISALLRLSVDLGLGDRVYEIMHRLRATVRQVSEQTGGIVEEWFRLEVAVEVGQANWDVEEVKEGVVKGGGGWHGKGWLGSGKWRVERTHMDEKGVCHSCGEKLVCIDIDPRETENFATSLTNLACQREVKADFLQFQEWLQRNGPFDAVVDGANVGLINQKTFSFSQLNSVVNELREMSPSKKLPLIVLHKGRVNGGPAENPNNKKLLTTWKKYGALYPTPAGSNDDWYWLYAAVSSKCLLLTNDEMRDHLFQLLGTSFFPRWKEKHQVRMTVSRSGIKLHMPPPYSVVIQESEQGNWHIPTVAGDDLEVPRQWVCATRS